MVILVTLRVMYGLLTHPVAGSQVLTGKPTQKPLSTLISVQEQGDFIMMER